MTSLKDALFVLILAFLAFLFFLLASGAWGAPFDEREANPVLCFWICIDPSLCDPYDLPPAPGWLLKRGETFTHATCEEYFRAIDQAVTDGQSILAWECWLNDWCNWNM